MKPKVAILLTILWFGLMLLLRPAYFNHRRGQVSLLRFDPIISTNYNCVFVEARTRAKFAAPLLSRSTPADYFRIRYTPHDGQQQYGIMYIDPKTMAYEGHSGFAAGPTRLSGKLDSPLIIQDWMRSQARHGETASDADDARELYESIVDLSKVDLEHFTLSTNRPLTNFEVGHTALIQKRPKWHDLLLPFVLIWLGVIGGRFGGSVSTRKGRESESSDQLEANTGR